MTPRRKSDRALLAVTNQYPQDLLDGLNSLVTETHIPKAHHLREALRRYLEAYGRRPRPLWEFCGERVPVVVSSPQKGRTASLSEMYALIALGDHLYPSQLDVYLSGDGTWRRDSVLSENLIVLGGPRQNQAATQLLRHWDKLIPFQLREKRSRGNSHYALENRETGESWVPDSARADRVADDFNDFGLIVKASGPEGFGTCLLLAGCHAFGTHAALRALVDPRSVAVIRRLIPSTEADFAAVVQVRVRNFCPEPPLIADLTVISD